MAIVLNGTTGIQFPPSSALSPSATNTTSTDTGIYYPTGTTLAFTTSGAERMRIDSSGNVAVGTSSSTYGKFGVASGVNFFGVAPGIYNSAVFGPRPANDGYSSINYYWDTFGSGNFWVTDHASSSISWQRYSSGSASGILMTLTSNGNVGIGTSIPSYKLQVQMPTSGIGAAFRYLGGTNNPGLFFSTNESTTVSQIDASGSTSGILALATSSIERMRIDSSGNVGIGTSPTYKFEVYSGSLGTTIGDQSIMTRLTTGVTNINVIDISSIRDNTGSDWNTAGSRLQQKVDATWMGWLQFNGDGNQGGLALGTGVSLSGPLAIAERMRILSDGRVGIGTTNPIRKFVVSSSGAKGIELSPNTGSLSGNEWLNYNRSTLLYIPSQVYASTHTFHAGTNGEARMVDINTAGLSVGVNAGTSGGTLSVYGGVTVQPTVYGGGSASPYTQPGTYTLGNGRFLCYGTNTVPSYVHMVLPARYNIANSKMFCLELKGYAYGDTKIINIMISGYVTPLSNGGPMNSVAVWDAMSYFSPTAYYSYNYNAGIARIYLPNQYYVSFVVNSIAVGNGDIIQPSELQIIISSSATI